MRKLKTLGVNNAGLKKFFESNIRSISIYGTPAWFTVKCKQSKDKLESIQRHAARVIFPHLPYDERLIELRTQTLHDFIFSFCVNHFKWNEGDPSHPLSTPSRNPLGLEILALPISVQQYVEPRIAQTVFLNFFYIFQQSMDLYWVTGQQSHSILLSLISLKDTVMAKQI